VADEQLPFADVVLLEDGGFSIPPLKWRELLFVGAVRAEGQGFVREPSRALPSFRIDDLFPSGVRFEAVFQGGRVVLHRCAAAPDGSGVGKGKAGCGR